MISVRAAIITGRREVQLQDFSVPCPSNSEILVRTELCGICTPEQRVYRGTRQTYPYWGGHELCGIVEEAQTAAPERIHAGDRVALALMQRCGKCHACLRGLDNHCAYLHEEVKSGFPLGPRGLTDRIAVPPYKAFVVPRTVAPEQAALAEPLACVLHSVNRAQPRIDEFVAVIGAGTMGLIHAAVVKRIGCRILMVDDDEETYQQALAAGADEVGPLDLLADRPRIHGMTQGWGIDVVFCTRSGTKGIEKSMSTVARGGRIVLYQSVTDDGMLRLDMNAIHYREVKLLGTIAQTAEDVAAAINWLSIEPTSLSFLHTEIVPLASIAKAFERAIIPYVNRVMVDFR